MSALSIETTCAEADTETAAGRLAQAIRFTTVSPEDGGKRDRRAFLGLHVYLERALPLVHRNLEREVIGDLSLLYTWKGRDPALKPILLSAHLDVVPAQSEAAWSHPPFGGRIADGFIWGRGALDDKAAVLGILEAVELLLTDGVRPSRTVYLAFGHDEERGGSEGAATIASLLGARGVSLQYVLDEGLVIGSGLVPGVRRPTAVIGVAEKGRLLLELVARGAHGHASMPPSRSAIGALARGLVRLEANPMPASLRSPMRELLECLAPEMELPRRIAFSNLGLFGPLVTHRLGRAARTNATIRTTMAITMASAGTKANVLPGEARAVVDVRILPGDTVAAIVAHVCQVLDDPAIEIRASTAVEPSPVSPTDGPGFLALVAVLRQVFPDAVVAPGLLVAGTDSKHYLSLTEAVYRFRPFRMTPDDVGRFHGVDERIGIADYARLVTFYTSLLRNVR
jgi:carboxypeptidase PM20D1